MKAILIKEIQLYFGSAIGYLVIGLFLLFCGLFLWVFDNQYNILNAGFADLTPFFTLAPWILLFLIPAVTMRSFADEKKQGTLELLLTKPITIWEIVLGKFLASVILLVIAILPTIVYFFIVYNYGLQKGNIDLGNTIGSYLGLILLMANYAAIGVFSSSITENQIVAFLIGVVICFIAYFGFTGISTLSIFKDSGNFLAPFGMDYHFKSISRGVVDSRDLIYFLSATFLFLWATQLNIKFEKK